MEEMHFYEVQKFSKNWLWYLQLLIIIGLSFVFIYQVVLGKQFGSKPASNGTIILMNFLVIIIFIFFNSLALYTQINSSVIKIKFYPLVTEVIPWNSIRKMEIINYKNVGYGIRISSMYGKIYNTNGKTGLLITKNDGDRILLGTNYADELGNQLKAYVSGNSSITFINLSSVD